MSFRHYLIFHSLYIYKPDFFFFFLVEKSVSKRIFIYLLFIFGELNKLQIQLRSFGNSIEAIFGVFCKVLNYK